MEEAKKKKMMKKKKKKKKKEINSKIFSISKVWVHGYYSSISELWVGRKSKGNTGQAEAAYFMWLGRERQ